MGGLIGSISSIGSIFKSLTGLKKKSSGTMPILAVSGGLLAVTGVFAYFTDRRMKKLGAYIPQSTTSQTG